MPPSLWHLCPQSTRGICSLGFLSTKKTGFHASGKWLKACSSSLGPWRCWLHPWDGGLAVPGCWVFPQDGALNAGGT